MDARSYNLLGVVPSATDEEIHAAYRSRVKILHPDRFDRASQPVEWQMANEMLRELNEAYARLGKPSRTKPPPVPEVVKSTFGSYVAEDFDSIAREVNADQEARLVIGRCWGILQYENEWERLAQLSTFLKEQSLDIPSLFDSPTGILICNENNPVKFLRLLALECQNINNGDIPSWLRTFLL